MRRLVSTLVVAATAMTLSAFAQPSSAAEEDQDPVFIFNRICYAQVPNVQAIRDMAQRLAWKPIEGDDLKRFTAIEKPDVLQGWDVQVGVRLFRVGIVQSTPVEGMKKSFPAFADGTATSCSIVLDGGFPVSVFAKNMQVLAGKPPLTKDVPEGDFLTTTWAGGNEDIKVFLVSKANIGGQGGLLSVTVLAKGTS